LFLLVISLSVKDAAVGFHWQRFLVQLSAEQLTIAKLIDDGVVKPENDDLCFADAAKGT
jgi:hypothetical protein